MDALLIVSSIALVAYITLSDPMTRAGFYAGVSATAKTVALHAGRVGIGMEVRASRIVQDAKL